MKMEEIVSPQHVLQQNPWLIQQVSGLCKLFRRPRLHMIHCWLWAMAWKKETGSRGDILLEDVLISIIVVDKGLYGVRLEDNHCDILWSVENRLMPPLCCILLTGFRWHVGFGVILKPITCRVASMNCTPLIRWMHPYRVKTHWSICMHINKAFRIQLISSYHYNEKLTSIIYICLHSLLCVIHFKFAQKLLHVRGNVFSVCSVPSPTSKYLGIV